MNPWLIVALSLGALAWYELAGLVAAVVRSAP